LLRINSVMYKFYNYKLRNYKFCYWAPHACSCVSTCTWPCTRIHMVMYPPASGCVSMCGIWLCTMCTLPLPCARGHVSTWSCIHMQMAMYPHAEFIYVLWAVVGILLSARGYSTECCCVLWATAWNNEPQRRITWTSFKSLPQP
jgi:hypothetical protein